MKLILFSFLIVLSFTLTVSQDITVITKLGDVLGRVEQSVNGENYYAFLGIPYAEPPVGKLRWQTPVPVQPWTETFDGRNDGPVCHQHSFFGLPNEVSENCLSLNIFTKNVFENGSLLPVIVDIHGGAFTAGGITVESNKPTYLMDYDVLYVAIQYRLGVLGFLSAGIESIPGNAGLKDQVLALKWVQENIESFGGNPNEVTIMGYSAGGMSVAAHLVSPMSVGLFHRAVPMSGGITSHFLLPEFHQYELFEKIARSVGCYGILGVIECLQSIPAQNLENAVSELFEFSSCPLFSLLPVIEADFGQERFFIEQPAKTLASGNFNKVPVLTGMASDEFATAAHLVLNNDENRERMDQNFNELAPVCFMYERNTERSNEISEVLRSSFVPSALENSTESLTELQKLFGDSLISHGVHRMVQLLGPHTSVFYYKFSYVGRFSLFYFPADQPWGVEHSDELMYLFEVPLIAPRFTENDPEYATLVKFTRLFVNFVTNGNPNNPDDEYIGNIEWIPFNSDDQNYMDLNNVFEMKSGLFLDRYHVWDELFPVDLD